MRTIKNVLDNFHEGKSYIQWLDAKKDLYDKAQRARIKAKVPTIGETYLNDVEPINTVRWGETQGVVIITQHGASMTLLQAFVPDGSIQIGKDTTVSLGTTRLK